jgi:hypothetical protein
MLNYRNGLILVGLLLFLLLLGCTDTPTGSDVTTLITGRILKEGAGLEDAVVDLYDDEDYTLLDSTFTDAAGSYDFQNAPYGKLQVKRSSGSPDEFGYVRYIFTLSSDSNDISVPAMDVSNRGLIHLSPADGDSVTTPDAFNPLTFIWSSYQGEIDYNSARLYDEQDSLLWSSAETPETTAAFNGIMNQGSYSGNQVTPGAFRWRVKVKLPNRTKAATVKTDVIFR